MNEILIFNNCFNDIRYYDHTHEYKNLTNNKFYPSVTKLLSQLVPKFDSRFWSVYHSYKESGYVVKDNRNGTITVSKDGSEEIINPYFTEAANLNKVTPKDILKMWEVLSMQGTDRGTYLHNYLENILKRKEITPEYSDFYSENTHGYGYITPYRQTLLTLEELAKDFYKNVIINNYIVVAQEFVVGDTDYEIAGTFDLLLYNLKTKEYELWDFKTDKDINKKGMDKFRYFGLPNTSLNKYALQLGIYKHIINKNTPIKINASYIVHFNYNDNKYSIIEVDNYDEEIKQFLENGEHKSTLI